jgi:hypothetical protein
MCIGPQRLCRESTAACCAHQRLLHLPLCRTTYSCCTGVHSLQQPCSLTSNLGRTLLCITRQASLYICVWPRRQSLCTRSTDHQQAAPDSTQGMQHAVLRKAMVRMSHLPATPRVRAPTRLELRAAAIPVARRYITRVTCATTTATAVGTSDNAVQGFTANPTQGTVVDTQ